MSGTGNHTAHSSHQRAMRPAMPFEQTVLPPTGTVPGTSRLDLSKASPTTPTCLVALLTSKCPEHLASKKRLMTLVMWLKPHDGYEQLSLSLRKIVKSSGAQSRYHSTDHALRLIPRLRRSSVDGYSKRARAARPLTR